MLRPREKGPSVLDTGYWLRRRRDKVRRQAVRLVLGQGWDRQVAHPPDCAGAAWYGGGCGGSPSSAEGIGSGRNGQNGTQSYSDNVDQSGGSIPRDPRIPHSDEIEL